jgi:uncharacterized protein (TIGR03790 family)
MKTIVLTLLLAVPLFPTLLMAASAPAHDPIDPKRVAVLYNNQIPESEELARFYAEKRGIPRANLVGLELSSKGEISRKEYNETLRDPLIALFISRNWWKMARTPQGQILPGESLITTMVSMRGVPYKIKREPLSKEAAAQAKKLPPHFAKANEASVDSELCMLGIRNLPTLGPANNPYFKKDISIAEAKLPYILLVGRIDAPDYATCKRMITDALATEKRGLWGMCYLDLAKKGSSYAIGDQWLESIAKLNDRIGIPTVVDRNKQTFTTNYPMGDAALYYGWYTSNQNGPLLNPKFKFRQGAFAVHLHSFSASNLRNAKRNWVGPILAHGAAATVGNVYEPYLQFTHHFDILHDRLIKGYSLVEAAYMACPALSWQNVVLGDPLYRPFLHLDGSGVKDDFDKNYRAIRVANQLWEKEPETLVTKLRSAAAAKSNARLYEYLGLWYRARHRNAVAIAFFQTASRQYMLSADRLRQWIHIADIQREDGNKKLAIQTLKQAKLTIANIPEIKSITALLNILDPPPPPPAAKQKQKTKKKKK